MGRSANQTSTGSSASPEPTSSTLPPTSTDRPDTTSSSLSPPEPDSRQSVGTDRRTRDPTQSTSRSSTAATGGPIALPGSPNHFFDTPPPHVVRRGVSVPAAARNAPPVNACLQGRHDLPPVMGGVPHTPVKKAVVVGMNYSNSKGGQPLRYGVKDATRFAKTLIERGFLKENIIVLVDEPSEEGQERPTFSVLMWRINWLVRGARAGDDLVFFFSGHGVNQSIFTGIIAADGIPLGRDFLEQHLVGPVPTGCKLQIILDCCCASAMIRLQYCIGRMIDPAELFLPEPSSVEQVTVSAGATELRLPASDAFTSLDLSPAQSPVPTRGAFSGSFHGLVSVNPAGPLPASSSSGSGSFVLSNNATPRRPRGNVVIAAAPPSPPNASANNATGTEAGWGEYLASFVGMGQAPAGSPAMPPQASTSRAGQRTRHGIAEGDRLPDYFAERKKGFVQTAGHVTFWAGTGENQRNYEAHHRRRELNGTTFRVKNGIVANAICTVLDARINQNLTVRDVWSYLVGAVDEENGWRRERDAKKEVQPDPKDRVQQPELWVSQPELLKHAAPALDRPMHL